MENRQFFHFGPWDYCVFLTTAIVVYKTIKCISRTLIAYFNSQEEITIKEN